MPAGAIAELAEAVPDAAGAGATAVAGEALTATARTGAKVLMALDAGLDAGAAAWGIASGLGCGAAGAAGAARATNAGAALGLKLGAGLGGTINRAATTVSAGAWGACRIPPSTSHMTSPCKTSTPTATPQTRAGLVWAA